MKFIKNHIPKKSEIFVLQGKFSDSAIENYRNNILPLMIDKYSDKIDCDWKAYIDEFLNMNYTPNHKCFFASFSYDDLNIGTTFEVAFDYDNIKKDQRTKVKIIAFIHEWTLLPMKSVGKGHRSICLLNFEDGIPEIIQGMREIEKFTSVMPGESIGLCNEETWKSIRVIQYESIEF